MCQMGFFISSRTNVRLAVTWNTCDGGWGKAKFEWWMVSRMDEVCSVQLSSAKKLQCLGLPLQQDGILSLFIVIRYQQMWLPRQ